MTNYSSIELPKGTESLCNLGPNYAFLPRSVDKTSLHAGWSRLEYSMTWKEHLYVEPEPEEEQNSATYKKPPWKVAKTRLPKQGPSPDLNTFLKGSLNCTLSSDLNKVHNNITPIQSRARDELQRLQKQRVIIIKWLYNFMLFFFFL